MYSYKEQLDMLRSIRLQNGESVRTDCVFCGGSNTLGIRKVDGKLSWNCFKASCVAHGIQDTGRTLEDIKRYLAGEGDTKPPQDLPPETSLFSVDNNHSCLEYLNDNHCLEAYKNKLATIRYYPKEDRIMFAVKDESQNVIGWSGRRLDGTKAGGKWRKYGDTDHVFTCGSGEIGVVVEDAPSACAVGSIEGYTGLSLLGTMLTLQKKIELRRYKSLIFCLDKDASSKAIELSSKFSNATVRFVPNDLKYYDQNHIRGIINGHL